MMARRLAGPAACRARNSAVVIRQTARSRPTTTSSHNEAPIEAENTSAMIMSVLDLDRRKGLRDGPARSSLALGALCGCRLTGEYGQAAAGLGFGAIGLSAANRFLAKMVRVEKRSFSANSDKGATFYGI